MKLTASLPALSLIAALPAIADVTIDPGLTEALAGDGTAEIAVGIVGGDPLTDLVGAVRVAGASITGVSYLGSIWASAPGGFVDLGFIGYTPPGESVDPNLSLNVAGESVAASGVPFTVTVDVSALAPGDYAVTLSGTPAGDTIVYNSGIPPATTALPGTLRILEPPPKPFDLWRAVHFPDDLGDPATEAAIWGELADPDFDLIPNFHEFALGLDPNDPSQPPVSASAPGAPVARPLEDGGETFLAIEYSRRTAAPCHVVELGVSTDLVNWDYSEDDIEEVAAPLAIAGTDYELVVRRYALPISGTDSRVFLRLRARNLAP